MIRMEYSSKGEFVDQKTQIVVNREFEQPEFNTIESDEYVEIITSHVHLYYRKGKFSPSTLFIDVKNNYTPYGNRWIFGQKINTLKGTARTLDEIDGSVSLEEGIVSKDGYALLDDSKSFIFLDESDKIIPRNGSEIDQYFFAYGREYKKALKDFYHLTGETPLLPRYALGNWWSRFWNYSEVQYLELMNKFDKNEIPLSISVIDMDWHLTEIDSKYGSGWTGYTWNQELFPDPKRFLQLLHNRGLKITLNVHPASGIRAFESMYPAVAKKLNLNQELEEPAKFDIANTKFRETYFEDVHHPLEEDGVDFWWIDWQQGSVSESEGLDPLWLLNYYHYNDIQKEKGNDIILSRYAGPGSHRYPIGFSGDTITTWESLKFQPYFTATASNIGYSWWSHDIGGHMRGYFDEELSLRWAQFGVFSPINRLHSSKSEFSSKEPWIFSDSVFRIMAKYLRLRHTLIPYLYTMNVKTSEESLPLILPMYYEFPENEEAYLVPNEYYFGTELIVLPITEKIDPDIHLASEKIWLPEGEWFDIFSGKRYKGGSTLRIFRSLENIPVLAKAGAIIPMDSNAIGTKGDNLPKELTWQIYPGENNTFSLVEDSKGHRAITEVELDWLKREICITIKDTNNIIPKERKNRLTIYGVDYNSNHSDKGYNINHKNNSITISLDRKSSTKISLKDVEIVKNQDVKDEVFTILSEANISYDLKDTLWRKFNDEEDGLSLIAFLNELENKKLGQALFEFVYIENS
ncbi:TIM-barrel domain-containing protein [Lacticigenium naphthae]|uniref:glycoside hydrolase family 31 protein n=1 Tax=Lacticigenium naphthae TaxID=515351 RepID=UPI0006889A5C|nr:TIM-barrel domain-containing protein [Lacticigenium naphthae]